LRIKEINVKNIITKSNLPDTDYVVNPYTGCINACIYCYARFMKRFTGHDEEWGSFVDIKVNADSLLIKNTDKYKGKNIFLSSVTDAYQPIEKKYQITRKILTQLIKYNPNLCIQTKSDLVIRDIDIIKKFNNPEIGFTITTLDDSIRKKIEPNTSPVIKRINALKKLKENNIRTYVFIGPFLPLITDWKNIIKETKAYVNHYCFENLNIYGSIWADIKKWLENNNKSYLYEYNKIKLLKKSYWDKLKNEIIDYCNLKKIKYKIYFYHGENKKNK